MDFGHGTLGPMFYLYFLICNPLSAHIYFWVCFQATPAMSRRSRLSQEELEVQQAISPGSNASNQNTPNPGQRTRAAQAEAGTQIVSLQDLTQFIQQEVVTALQSKAHTVGSGGVPPAGGSRKRVAEVVDGLPLPPGPLVAAQTPIQFGVDVNAPPTVVGVEEGHGPALPDVPTGVPSVPPVVPDPTVVPAAPVVEPDPALPSAGSSDPPNWHPDPAVLAWAKKMVDACEWSPDDRKAIRTQFTPDPEHDHLFEAVHMPPDIITAMKHKKTTDSDWLFNRYTAETFFFNANWDITTCYRPLLEVISNLKDSPGHASDRVLLGRVFQGLVASTVKISRGRRELGRRFVPLANAAALFRSTPSHKCIFGGDSTEAAVEQAVKESKCNKSLVYVPPASKQPFRASGSSSKGFRRFPYSQYQQPRYSGRGYVGGGSSQYYTGRDFYKSQRGRQRGRGGRGKKRQSGASTSQDA